MKINELDVVKCKDGRTGIVMHVYSDGKAVEIEFDNTEEIETVEIADIDSVIERAA